jgi:hypothetical protein
MSGDRHRPATPFQSRRPRTADNPIRSFFSDLQGDPRPDPRERFAVATLRVCSPYEISRARYRHFYEASLVRLGEHLAQLQQARPDADPDPEGT